MVDARDASKYFKPSNGETYTIKDSGAIEPVKAPDGATSDKVVIGIREAPKPIIVNATSNKALTLAWGPDTERWVGKKFHVESVRQMVMGALKDVLVFVPLTGKK
jgi:hypothetical protein